MSDKDPTARVAAALWDERGILQPGWPEVERLARVAVAAMGDGYVRREQADALASKAEALLEDLKYAARTTACEAALKAEVNSYREATAGEGGDGD